MSNLATLIPQKSGWAHLPTVAIRVPQAFKSQILEFAKALDNGSASVMGLDPSKYSLEKLLDLQASLPDWIARARNATQNRTLETALLRLAGMCDGAHAQDGAGFNAYDAEYGHYLAREAQAKHGLSPGNAKKALDLLQKYVKTQLKDLALPAWDAIKHQYSVPKIVDLPDERIELTGSSVLVFSPYDPTGKFQAKAKAITGFKFDSKEKSWSFPIAQLQAVLDAWPEFERINPQLFEGISLYQKMQAQQETEAQKEKATEKAQYVIDLLDAAKLDQPLANGWNLFAHQIEAAEWLLSRSEGGVMRGGILADDMGLGKTLSALSAAKAIATLHKIPIFVVCPASLKDNWLREAERVGVAIEVYSWAKLPQPLELQRYVLIADEAHYAQNSQSKRGKALIALAQSKNCLATWLLTGTPIKNGRPINLMPLLMAIQHPLVANHWDYQRRYCNAHRGAHGWDNTGASHLDELQAKTTDIILRRKKKDCLDLPSKLRSLKPVELESSVRKEYEKKISELVQDYRDRAARGEVSGEAEALATLGILRKTGSEFKVAAAIELAQELLEQGEQVVIFTEFLESAHAIHSALGGELLTGATPNEQRQGIVDRFQSGESKVFVGTIKAGGVGLTLTAASNVIMMDRPWTPGDAEQAEDRCHRIGQNATVTAFWLQLGAIDQSIDSLIEQKQERIELVLKGKRKTLRGIKSAGDLAKELLKAL